jgi:hypothetical protein
MTAQAAPNTFCMRVCRAAVRLTFEEAEHHDPMRAYFAPSLIPDSSSLTIDAEARITRDGIEVLRGPSPAISSAQLVVHQVERLIIEWCSSLASGGVLLHAGGVVRGKRPILLIAPSGHGKSTMTRAAVRAGCWYLTDDLLSLSGGSLSGLGRAIRFDSLPLKSVPPAYLEGMDLSSIRVEKSGGLHSVPILANGLNYGPEFVPEAPAVVVEVSRGPDELTPLSELERIVTLHEAAIKKSPEYDGCLGPGPGYRLSWQDPDRAFALLADELDKLDS